MADTTQGRIAPALTLDTIAVRQIDGLFSLNDLHAASGGEDRHQPAKFIRLDQTQALVTELGKSPEMANCIETKRGANGGTYACRELVIAYAAWISAAFHLKVIRVFLTQTTPTPAPAIEPEPARKQSRATPEMLKKVDLCLRMQELMPRLMFPALMDNTNPLPCLELPQPVRDQLHQKTAQIAAQAVPSILQWLVHNVTAGYDLSNPKSLDNLTRHAPDRLNGCTYHGWLSAGKTDTARHLATLFASIKDLATENEATVRAQLVALLDGREWNEVPA